jgi:predicted alpha-1,2-mannosidase
VEKGVCYYAQALERDSSRYAASHVLEYSFSAYAVAQFAKALGKTTDYELLMKQSENWKNIYDPEVRLFRPRNTKGEFIAGFNPLDPHQGFQEGNSTQYSFYVPHTPELLVDLIGKEEFNTRLNDIFTEAQKDIFGGGTKINAFSGLSALYNHGNQPCLFIPWLFNFSGKPWLTQKWVRAICNEFYGVEEIHGYGYGQDEDQGQLGAWYVMASIGLFDVKGLTEINPSFQIGSPLFDKITITLPEGKEFMIEAIHNSEENIYIQDMMINGVRCKDLTIPYSDIVNGGTLTLSMSDMPLKSN